MVSVRAFKADNYKWATNLAVKNFYDLIYMDVPFNTGKIQTRKDKKFSDIFEDYKSFNYPRLRVLKAFLSLKGAMMVHCDAHEGHYIKVWLDEIFGRDRFMGEILWTWDYGGKPKTKWAQKHNYIFWYVNDPKNYIFNYSEIDRVPYMSKAFISDEQYALGKVPTNVWFMTIVPTMSADNTGYPTQKPEKLLDRIIRVHTLSDSMVLDPFAGSGTTAASCLKYGRKCDLIDDSDIAMAVIKKRFQENVELINCGKI